jgi:flavin-dependent dehydrogenase
VKALLARRAGLDPPREILSGAQVEAPFHLEDPEKVELHLGVAPGLFAWVIPSGEETARIGLCTRESAWQLLQAFLRKDIISRRLLGSPCSLVVGGLPLGPPKATATEGFLAVGDAAGQVKPTSGGGIYPGLVCAKVAGAVAAAAALEGSCSAGRLQDYDRLWRSRIGRELEIGMRLRQLLDRMSDEETDDLLRYLGERPKLIKIVEEHGDIDRPSLLVARMVPHMGIDGIKLAKLLMHALR